MSNEVIELTKEGQKKLEDELRELQSVVLPQVLERLKTARSFGDLSENSEYDAAKEEQGQTEGRIREIKAILRTAHIINEDELTLEAVKTNLHVKIEAQDGSVREYDIKGSQEADPLNGKISSESPVGRGLIGKKVGETAEIVLPNGNTVQYKVLEISRIKKG